MGWERDDLNERSHGRIALENSHLTLVDVIGGNLTRLINTKSSM